MTKLTSDLKNAKMANIKSKAAEKDWVKRNKADEKVIEDLEEQLQNMICDLAFQEPSKEFFNQSNDGWKKVVEE